MCGRFLLKTLPRDLAGRLDAQVSPQLAEMPARFNIAPSEPILVLTDQGRGRILTLMKWGLVPHWAKDVTIGNRMINARSETVAEKPAFRDAFRYRRCIIPADGFCEWRKAPPGSRQSKQAYRITRCDGGLLALAGLWEHWQDAHGNELESCTILTTAANDLMAPIHDRMPVILDNDAYARWLSTPSQEVHRLEALLKPCDAAALTMTPLLGRLTDARPAHEDSADPPASLFDLAPEPRTRDAPPH